MIFRYCCKSSESGLGESFAAEFLRSSRNWTSSCSSYKVIVSRGLRIVGAKTATLVDIMKPENLSTLVSTEFCKSIWLWVSLISLGRTSQGSAR